MPNIFSKRKKSSRKSLVVLIGLLMIYSISFHLSMSILSSNSSSVRAANGSEGSIPYLGAETIF